MRTCEPDSKELRLRMYQFVSVLHSGITQIDQGKLIILRSRYELAITRPVPIRQFLLVRWGKILLQRDWKKKSRLTNRKNQMRQARKSLAQATSHNKRHWDRHISVRPWGAGIIFNNSEITNAHCRMPDANWTLSFSEIIAFKFRGCIWPSIPSASAPQSHCGVDSVALRLVGKFGTGEFMARSSQIFLLIQGIYQKIHGVPGRTGSSPSYNASERPQWVRSDYKRVMLVGVHPTCTWYYSWDPWRRRHRFNQGANFNSIIESRVRVFSGLG